MLNTIEKSADSNYKSPAHKLIKFFRKSRDNWKAKCMQAKYELKLKKNNVKYLKNNNKELKSRIKGLEQELIELQKKN